jgi:hypothetical protein
LRRTIPPSTGAQSRTLFWPAAIPMLTSQRPFPAAGSTPSIHSRAPIPRFTDACCQRRT